MIYPLGASLELVINVQTLQPMYALDPAKRPLSMTMPNQLNFAFQFIYFVAATPLLYAIQFPFNYGTLLRKRKVELTKLAQLETDLKAKKSN